MSRPPAVTLLAFGASWCAPWTVLLPGLQALVDDGLPVTVIDVDAEPARATERRVVVLPTFVVLRDGSERQRLTGAVSIDELRAAATAPTPRRRAKRRGPAQDGLLAL